MATKYTYEAYVGHNVFGAGHWECVDLYEDDKRIGHWSYDGTFFVSIAKRRLRKQIAYLRDVYGATVR